MLDGSNKERSQRSTKCAAYLDSQPQTPDPICHYCIVRTDIPIGLAFAQCVHAAGESSDGKLKPGTYAVALGVETEKQLHALADELEAKGVPVHRVEESHGKYAGQLMALGIAPGPKSVRGKHLSTLPLLRMVDFVEHHDYAQREWASRKVVAQEAQKLRDRIRELEASWWERTKQWWRRSKSMPSTPSQQEVK